MKRSATMTEENESAKISDAKVQTVPMKCIDELESLKRQNAELRGVLLQMLDGKKQGKLQSLPLCLQEDKEFIESAVRANAIKWSDLPQKWKDIDIACIFLENTKMRLPKKGDRCNGLRVIGRYYLSWRELPYHMKVNEKIIFYALRSHYGPKWNHIPVQFHSNIDLLCTALKYRKISFEDIPEDLQRNHKDIALYGILYNHLQADDCSCFSQEFFRKVLEDDEINWDQLPSTFRNDASFALSISRFSSIQLPEQILEHFREIRHDRSFWRKILEDPELKVHGLLKYLPAELRSDEDFMLDMCQVCTTAFELVDGNLASNSEFLKSALERNAAVLRFVPHETQELHQDLVVKTIPLLSSGDHMKAEFAIAGAIVPSFWNQFDFAMTWMSSGLGFPTHALDDSQLTAWRNDRRLCSAGAIHSKVMYYIPSIYKEEADFMLEVMDHHPELYANAAGDAKKDQWVMTTAFASCPNIAKDHFLALHLEGKEKDISDYLDFLEVQLGPFKIFCKYILANMLSTQSVGDTGTALTLLNQGMETSIEYKRRLAQYIGIPTGKWLWRLQQAEKNVREALAPWSQS